MSHRPRFLIAAHPTRGVDVGAQAQIWDAIREARRAGLAVLLISADLDELIGLSDTLRVIFDGRLVADADPATITPQELGSAMTGAASGRLEHAERSGHRRGLRCRKCRKRCRRRIPRGLRQLRADRGRGPMKQEVTKEGMKREIRKERMILALAAPVLALAVAVALTSIILLATGKNPFEPYSLMVSYVSEWPDVQVLVINQTVTYYFAALAVAIGFRMNLFNIGVEGQYRLGACVGAIVGFNLPAPGVVKMLAVIVTAMVVGAL